MRTSLPVLTQPLTSLKSSRPIILNNIRRVRGSRTCSFVARSALSFWLAVALGPLRFTPAPMPAIYGVVIFARREENLDRRAS